MICVGVDVIGHRALRYAKRFEDATVGWGVNVRLTEPPLQPHSWLVGPLRERPEVYTAIIRIARGP